MKLTLPDRLKTDRLVLSRLRYEDAEEIFYTYASKPEATRFVSWPTHRTLRDTRAYLAYAIPAWNAGMNYTYAIRTHENNRLIGSIGILNDSGKVQFGYILSPTQWNNGFATEVCKAIVTLLRNQPGVFRIWTLVDVENVASVKVLLKAGLIEEARLEKWFRFVNQNNQPKDCVIFHVQLP